MRSFKWSLCALSLLVLNTSATSRFDSIVGKLTHALGQELEEIVNTAPVYKAEAVNSKDRIDNVVLYWGQGDRGEHRLSYYCDQEGVSMIIAGFVVDFIGGPKKSPVLNLSDNCNDLNNCEEAARDIKYCQKKGIKILISVGGAVGQYHQQAWDPDLFAWHMWNKFLGGTDKSVARPFGDVILDGVDYDPESVEGAGYDRHIHTLRQLFKTQYPKREYLITAAPQCPDLDYYQKNAAFNILHPAPMYDAYPDMVFVQFYNNYCSASNHQSKRVTKFNFDVWDKWSREKTKGRTKVYLGLLGKQSRHDEGYVNYEKMTLILDDIRRKKSFGGVMFWDAHYAYTNPVPYLNGIHLGQATTKYLKQLTESGARTVSAFETIHALYKTNQVPVVVPLFGKDQDYLRDTMPCAGQSFLLLRPVSSRLLAESFGIATSVIDAHLESLGIHGDDLVNSGSRICLKAVENDISLGYIYNATLPEEQDVSDYDY